MMPTMVPTEPDLTFRKKEISMEVGSLVVGVLINGYRSILAFINTVTGVATQGRSDYPQIVTKYKLLYSQDGKDFLYYRETGQTEDKVILFNMISAFSLRTKKCYNFSE